MFSLLAPQPQNTHGVMTSPPPSAKIKILTLHVFILLQQNWLVMLMVAFQLPKTPNFN